jgi:hypothetical protein
MRSRLACTGQRLTLCRGPVVAPIVRALSLMIYPFDKVAETLFEDDVVRALVRTLGDLEGITALRVKWDECFLPGRHGQVLHPCWPIVGPRLKCLHLWLSATDVHHLLEVGPWACGLKELALVITGRASSVVASEFAWERLVPTLIAPAHAFLMFLTVELSFRVVVGDDRWDVHGDDNQPGPLALGRLFAALADLRFPKLRHFLVRSCFNGAMTGAEEEPLLRFVAAHNTLQELAIMPSIVETLCQASNGLRDRSLNTFGLAYQSMLRIAARHLPSGLTRLALYITPPFMMRGIDVLPEVVGLLSALPYALEELWLDALGLSADECAQVIHSLRHVSHNMRVLRICVEVLRPSTLDLLVAGLPHVCRLTLQVSRLGCDEVCAPSRGSGFGLHTYSYFHPWRSCMLPRSRCVTRSSRAYTVGSISAPCASSPSSLIASNRACSL